MATEIQLEQRQGSRRTPRLDAPMSRLRWFVLIAVVAPGATPLRAQLVQPNVIVSVRDQKLMFLDNGCNAAVYPVSTSKFGLGDRWGSMATPLGTLQVAQKIGDHAPTGAVFHNRRFTGEILQPNAPGRDPIVTRIIWLRGLEAANAHAYNRGIYIHGTPEEKTIGRPASYGCIRMKSSDVSALYAQLPIGAIVQITPDHLPKVSRASKGTLVSAPASGRTPTHAVFTADSSKPGAEKASITPLAPKTSVQPAKKSDATAWLRNARA
jgi:lipoprotein-anchoring transpeptidase ErfK/SrfK